MSPIAAQALQTICSEFQISQDEVIQESLKVFLEKKLREIKTEIFRIHGKFRVTSVEALEGLFVSGVIEEKDALGDYQKLDHLEFRRDEILRLLKDIQ